MKLPVDAVRSSDITDLMRKHMETVDGVSYIQVSPTYLYESMWCLALLILLLLYRRHKKFQGEVFLMYLLGYGAGRVWIEGLRTDQLWIPGTEIPVSQVLAGTIVVVSFVLIVYNRIKVKKKSCLLGSFFSAFALGGEASLILYQKRNKKKRRISRLLRSAGL